MDWKWCSSRLHTETIPTGPVVRDFLGEMIESWSLWTHERINALILLPLQGEDTTTADHLGRRVHATADTHARTWISDSPASRAVGNKCLLFIKHSVSRILIPKRKRNKIPGQWKFQQQWELTIHLLKWSKHRQHQMLGKTQRRRQSHSVLVGMQNLLEMGIFLGNVFKNN